MYTYYSKHFVKYEGREWGIDEWLNSFTRKLLPNSEYNFDVVGYVSIGHGVMITIRVFELVKN